MSWSFPYSNFRSEYCCHPRSEHSLHTDTTISDKIKTCTDEIAPNGIIVIPRCQKFRQMFPYARKIPPPKCVFLERKISPPKCMFF